MNALDLTADLRADGTLSPSASRQIAAHLRTAARGLDEGDTLTVRVQIGPKLRSGRQNRLYRGPVLGRISLAYLDAGRPFPAEALHTYYKGLYLPAVAADVLNETGEVLDVERWLELPDGSHKRLLTTTALTVGAFRLYLERIAWDDDVVAMGVDLSDLLDEAATVRSGRLAETDAEREVDFSSLVPMANGSGARSPAPASPAAAADPLAGLSEAGRIQARLAELL